MAVKAVQFPPAFRLVPDPLKTSQKKSFVRLPSVPNLHYELSDGHRARALTREVLRRDRHSRGCRPTCLDCEFADERRTASLLSGAATISQLMDQFPTFARASSHRCASSQHLRANSSVP